MTWRGCPPRWWSRRGSTPPPATPGRTRPRPPPPVPPALVVTGGYDPRGDEAEAYARGLADAGVAVRLAPYPGMIHGFLRRFATFDQGKHALAEITRALREALGVDAGQAGGR